MRAALALAVFLVAGCAQHTGITDPRKGRGDHALGELPHGYVLNGLEAP